MSEPGSFTALSAQVFQPPTAPAAPAPLAPPLTPSGGVGVPPGPVTVPGGTFSTPSPIVQPQFPQYGQPPVGVTPYGQQPPVAPQYAAPAPMQPVAPPPQPIPSRTQIDRLVQNGTFTAQDVQGLNSDAELFDALLTLGRQEAPAAPVPPSVAPVTPVAPSLPSTPVRSDLTAAAQALQAHGLLEMRGGMYVPKAPEAQAIADSLNLQIQSREQTLTELNDPTGWLTKHGEQVFAPRFKSLEQRIEQLQNQLAEAAPKPHLQWVEQNKANLYTEQNGQRVFSPAGNAYNQTWDQLASLGYTDVKQLHASASQAALAAMRAYQAAPPAQPPQTFMQGAQQYQAPTNPGFTAPGTPLSNQNPQTATPVNSLGLPDWNAIQTGILNGSIVSPRAM